MIVFLTELERVNRTYYEPRRHSVTTYQPDPDEPDPDTLPAKPPIEDQLPEDGIDPPDEEDDVPAEAFLPGDEADADETVDNREQEEQA